LGVVNAEYLAQPRLKLLDESRRVVPSAERPAGCWPPPAAGAQALARRRPPRVLKHWHAAAPPSRSGLEPVGKYHDRPNGRDIDYVVPRSAAGDDLIALLADEVEPTVIVRRYSTGDTDLLTSFEM
jgi:hypothetical protein